MLTHLLITPLLLLTTQNAPAAGAKQPATAANVTVHEIADFRRVRPNEKPNPNGLRVVSGERPGLKLVIDLHGPDAISASHYGMFELESAADDKGAKLKLADDALTFNDLRKEMLEVDRERMFVFDENPPKDAIRIELPFENPNRGAAAISIRGRLQLKRVATLAVLVPAKVGAVVNDQLEKAGVKIKIKKPGQPNGFSYEISGKTDMLNAAQLVDAAGKPIETNGSATSESGSKIEREVYLENPVPSGTQLKLDLVTKAETIPLTIDLKDIKLP